MHQLNAPRPIIGVIVNSVGGYSRGVVRGITSYAFARTWMCRVQGINDIDLTAHLSDFDGFIVQAASSAELKLLAAVSKPVVNVSSALPLNTYAQVVSDDVAVGRMGADYFLRRGYRHFAFYSPDLHTYVKLRQSGFNARLREAGETCHLTRTTDQLLSLLLHNTPLAVMGSNDRAAVVVLDACRQAGINVPDSMAVLGVDNDDLIQSLAHPPLSTINTARQRIGFEAAAMLERLMRREEIPDAPVFIAPTGVITRRSTDLFAVSDPGVTDALHFIHAHAGRTITVDDVLREVPFSRRQLERRFREALGRSILDEITRCRMDRARQLLIDTELTLPQIALASGFASASYFAVVFKRQSGLTPGMYRTQFTQHATSPE
jgi:LacI family transcriptional regulator